MIIKISNYNQVLINYNLYQKTFSFFPFLYNIQMHIKIRETIRIFKGYL